jgi:hypothetical protein
MLVFQMKANPMHPLKNVEMLRIDNYRLTASAAVFDWLSQDAPVGLVVRHLDYSEMVEGLGKRRNRTCGFRPKSTCPVMRQIRQVKLNPPVDRCE